jgi:hypothetical protein
MSAPSSLADVVKIVVAKARKESALQLECVPASVPVRVLLTLLAPVSLSVLSSSCAHGLLLLGSGATDATCPLADLACADIAAATA